MIRPIILGNALAVTSGVFFSVCAVFAALVPTGMHSVGQAWYGGMGMGSPGMMQAGSMGWGAFFYGLFWLLLGAWLFGTLLGFLYNRFGGERADTAFRSPVSTGARERAGVS